ncbi:hypothetical protein SAMN04489733_6540 [Amycolatopsis keratiniphila]|nr:hypothetical protein SAMN04489733_6540 [Amycolatopsis keratiniphila]
MIEDVTRVIGGATRVIEDVTRVIGGATRVIEDVTRVKAPFPRLSRGKGAFTRESYGFGR